MSEQDSNTSPTVVINQNPTNSLGLAGFIVSLVSFLTCGILAPIALILSIIAMFKRPKGFAIAGLVISLFQLLLILVIGLGPILAIVGIGMAEKGKQEEAFNANRAEIIKSVENIDTIGEYYKLKSEYSFVQDNEYKRLLKEAAERVYSNGVPELDLSDLELAR